ncbi:MAG: 2Fe-2S iron-sulfur cluster binding domain-containing protein [Hyphomicrobiaceae bacterium]|nr:2Fe-2S iron-sulfur cluster binding domain-containing protein [Hyphomicrobiaceae bacterium]
MSQPVTIEIAGKSITAFRGDRLLDALHLAGLSLPGDCRNGTCGLCPLRLVEGQVAGGSTAAGGILACRARVESNLRLELGERATVAPTAGFVAAITDLTLDVTEVTISLAGPYSWRPGQYAHVTFTGFPARAYSTTVALDGSDRPASLRLHVARLDGGVVSSELGRRINVGHPVCLEGPLGSAVLEPNSTRRLVLFSSGTGFAPIWAIADAALRENAMRRIVVVSGTRALENLYMAEALERMSRCANVTVLPVTAQPQSLTPIIKTGTPVDFAAMIAPGDAVHAAGPGEMVQAIGAFAGAAGATFRADPFTPSATADDRWLAQAARRFAPVPAERPSTLAERLEGVRRRAASIAAEQLNRR